MGAWARDCGSTPGRTAEQAEEFVARRVAEGPDYIEVLVEARVRQVRPAGSVPPAAQGGAFFAARRAPLAA
jgi:hypothetical protein